MHTNRWLLGTAAVLVIIAYTAVTWLRAAAPSTIGPLFADPAYVVINTPTPVTFSVSITDTSLIPGSVNLYTSDSTGRPIAILSQMYDDGTHGDVNAHDNVFTLTTILDQSDPLPSFFRASVGFRGAIRRSISAVHSVNTWVRFSGVSSPISFAYPSSPELTFHVEVESARVLILEALSRNQQFAPVLFIHSESTANSPQIEDWFLQHVDASGDLLVSTYTHVDLQDGITALLLTGGVPTEWDGGPLPDAFVRSADGTTIATIEVSQDNPLAYDGLSSTQITTLVNNIISTIQFR